MLERRGALVTCLNSKDGHKVVLKASLGRDPLSKYLIQAESIALEVLRGLAVPKRIPFSRTKAIKILGTQRFYHLAMEWVPEKPSSGRTFSTAQGIALWAFALEQMCAFRRKKVIYTDLKSDHICVSDDMTKAKFIDFDSCIMLEPSGRYPTMAFRYTANLSAPELYFSKMHSENVVVYQMGMLLGSLLLKSLSNSDLNDKTLEKIKMKFRKADCHPLYALFEKCISKSPVVRPKNLDSLFQKINSISLPKESYEIWNKLRAPYRKELLKVGFKDPTSDVFQLKAS